MSRLAVPSASVNNWKKWSHKLARGATISRMTLDIVAVETEAQKEALKKARYEIWKLSEAEKLLTAQEKHALAVVARLMLDKAKKEYRQLKEKTTPNDCNWHI